MTKSKKNSKTKKMKVLICLVLAVVVLAQSPPNIPDDFIAQAIMEETHGRFKVRYDGIIYESYSTKCERIDLQHSHEHPIKVELLRLYANEEEYDIQGADLCRKRQFNMSMHAMFGWLTNAKPGHECHARYPNKTVGASWFLANEHLRATACVTTADANTPLWITFKELTHQQVERRIDFSTFLPQTPNASYFAVPSICN